MANNSYFRFDNKILGTLGALCEITLMWMPSDPSDDRSTLVQVIWLCGGRQQAITWTNVDQVLWRHIASLWYNEVSWRIWFITTTNSFRCYKDLKYLFWSIYVAFVNDAQHASRNTRLSMSRSTKQRFLNAVWFTYSNHYRVNIISKFPLSSLRNTEF